RDVIWFGHSPLPPPLAVQVSAIIGLNSLTMKKRLLLTLREGLGPEAAFSITPLSFALPEELHVWEEWLREQKQQTERKPATKQMRQRGGAQGPERRSSIRVEGGAGATSGSGGGAGGGNGGGTCTGMWILKTGQDAVICCCLSQVRG
ncbi:hypothetical protein Vafri_349, partial [Volvox africanus]